MRCPACGHENRDSASFCASCGAALVGRCAQRGAELPLAARFCDVCGAPVAGGVAPQPPPSPALEPPSAEAATTSHASRSERRPLTVLFCDLVGSTPLSTQLDPEDLAEVLRAYYQACAVVVEQFGGHVARIIGDGLLVYFGYPVAHEDDPQRAVRAGLGIAAALGRLDDGFRRERNVHLAARVGIHTGLVVVGEMRSGDA